VQKNAWRALSGVEMAFRDVLECSDDFLPALKALHEKYFKISSDSDKLAAQVQSAVNYCRSLDVHATLAFATLITKHETVKKAHELTGLDRATIVKYRQSLQVCSQCSVTCDADVVLSCKNRTMRLLMSLKPKMTQQMRKMHRIRHREHRRGLSQLFGSSRIGLSLTLPYNLEQWLFDV